MSKNLEKYRDDLMNLCEKYQVKYMFAFGSVLRDDFNEDSDIDLLITFEDIPFEQYTDNYFDLHEELQRLFNRKVDLVTTRSLQNPVFIEYVDKTKQLVYAA